MRRLLLAIMLLALLPQTWAFGWQDLWVTKDQQAQAMMDESLYSKAEETFDNPAWQAAAAYRAGHYKEAAQLYQSLQNSTDNRYNQGNALAKSGQLEAAIKAYDKALALEPGNQDALHNRKVVTDLLKKNQQKNKNDQNKNNKQDQDKQDQDKQDQNKQDQDKQDQNKQDQNNQDQNRQDQNKQDQNKQDQNKQDQNKQDQNNQDQDKQDQDKQDQDKPDQDKQDQNKQEQNKKETPQQSQADREKQQAKQQWLRLIPDDPGGLMREKFLRDYLNRQRN